MGGGEARLLSPSGLGVKSSLLSPLSLVGLQALSWEVQAALQTTRSLGLQAKTALDVQAWV